MWQKYVYPEDKYLLIGSVAKAQGLRGEVSIYALSGQPENLRNYSALTLVDRDGKLSPELKVKTFRLQKDRAIILFETITDRNQAEMLIGTGVLLARDTLPELAADEFYWYQLTGCVVRTNQGTALGILQSFFSNGAQDVMVICSENDEFLVPVMPGVIVDQKDGELVIDPPPGLLEINTISDDIGTTNPA